MKNKTVILIGKPGSGKTTLLNEFSLIGYKVFNSDLFVHKIYKKGGIGYELVKNKFGTKYLSDTEVNRTELSKLAIKNKEALLELNRIIHPLVNHEIVSGNYDFVELPIYKSKHINFKYHKTIFVDIDNKLSIERLVKRGYTEDKARNYLLFWIEPDSNEYDIKLSGNKRYSKKELDNIINLLSSKND